MSAFLEDAERIFEGARVASQQDGSVSDLAILISLEGGIRFVEAAGWHLNSLAASYGAQRVYRVTRGRGRVRVEGRSGAETCLLQSEMPSETARRLLTA